MDVSNTTTTDTQYRPTTSPPKRGDAKPDWKDLLKGQRIKLKDPACPFEIQFRFGKQTLSRKCVKPMRLVMLVLVKGKPVIRCYLKGPELAPRPTPRKARTASPAPPTAPAA